MSRPDAHRRTPLRWSARCNRYNRAMSLTLLAPVDIVEAAQQLAQRGVRVPALEALAAGPGIDSDERALDAIAAAMLGIKNAQPVPVAALRYSTEECGAPDRDAHWLC